MKALVLLAVASGCGPVVATGVIRPDPSRTVCGWKEFGESAVLTVRADGEASGAPPGVEVLAVDAPDDATFGAVREALAPHNAHLVRVEVVVDGRWLLPLTFAGRPAPPIEGPKVETIVGHRRVIRPRAAPRLRFADIRLDAEGARLFVENDKVAGSTVAVAELAEVLRRIDPPATAFALTASAETPWSLFVAAVRAAACFDRGPGDEPHEVLLDERPLLREGIRDPDARREPTMISTISIVERGGRSQKAFTAPSFVP